MTRWMATLVLVAAGGCTETAPPREKTEQAPAPRIELAAPSVTEETAEVGRVTLKWVAGQGGATPGFFEVFRCDSKGGWNKVWTTESLEFIDLAVDGRATYDYKVRACLRKPDGPVESPFSPVVRAVTPCAVKLVYTGGSPQVASILVRKRMNGEWRERRYTVLAKDPGRNLTGEIGKLEAGGDDFRTGFVLTGIQKDRFKFKRKERRSRIENGVLITEDVEVDAERDRFKILYTDDEGAACELWIAEERPAGEDEK